MDELKAELFKGLAHPLRVRILQLLSAADEMSVAELLLRTGLEASHLSQHLSVLRRRKLVESERRANVVFYRLPYPEVAELLRSSRDLVHRVLKDADREHVALHETTEDGT